jgi:hypothetical protein
VTGINPIGFLRAFSISSSILDSVFSARRVRYPRITEIIKPLSKKAIRIVDRDAIIDPRLIPKNPVFQTSVTKTKKLFIGNALIKLYCYFIGIYYF